MNSSIDLDSMYCEFNDDENFREYYDLTKDPWQLQNAASTVSSIRRAGKTVWVHSREDLCW